MVRNPCSANLLAGGGGGGTLGISLTLSGLSLLGYKMGIIAVPEWADSHTKGLELKLMHQVPFANASSFLLRAAEAKAGRFSRKNLNPRPTLGKGGFFHSQLPKYSFTCTLLAVQSWSRLKTRNTSLCLFPHLSNGDHKNVLFSGYWE